jgi:hypothetical protein
VIVDTLAGWLTAYKMSSAVARGQADRHAELSAPSESLLLLPDAI